MFKMFKKSVSILLAALLLVGCAAQAAPSGAETDSATAEPAAESAAGAAPEAAAEPAAQAFTDAMGYEVTVASWDRVVSLYGSFAETWVMAGGTLVGTTSDAIEERQLALGEDVAIIGSVKTPSLEEIIALEPDFVILSADTAEHVDLHEALAAAGIPHAYYRIDTFADYLAMLGQFCAMTGRDDLYRQYGTEVQARIESTVAAVQGQPSPTVLLIRAYSTGAKAKGADILAGTILAELGGENLVDRYESLLEELSMEEIIAADPEYILVVPMGDEDKAAAYMAQTFETNPAWAGLTAVQNGRYAMLPKELFHYKPNYRWAESYEYMANILYPGLDLGA